MIIKIQNLWNIEIGLLVFLFLAVFFMFFSMMPISVTLDVYFYLLLGVAGINYLREKRFNLYQTWIASFIFVIQSEMFIISTDTPSLLDGYLLPFCFLLEANLLLLLGYHCKFSWPRENNLINKYFRVHVADQSFWFFVLFCFVAYVYNSAHVVIDRFTSGRETGNTLGSANLFSIISNAVGLILPAIIAYHLKYVRKSKLLWGWVVIIPIFLILVLSGTRFRLLFSVLPFLILINVIDLNFSDWRKNLKLFLVMVVLVSLSSMIKDYRYVAIEELTGIELEEEPANDDRLSVMLARNMSPEGVVYMTKLANDYFQNHSLSYGKEITFILYFWIPRGLWPSKPVPIDYWLIRLHERVSDSFSSASGFTGEIRADFGIIGALCIVFFGGMLLKKGDAFVKQVFSEDDYSPSMIIAAILFPYVFFVVRSPLTATQSLIFELLIYKLYCMLYTRKIYVFSD